MRRRRRRREPWLASRSCRPSMAWPRTFSPLPETAPRRRPRYASWRRARSGRWQRGLPTLTSGSATRRVPSPRWSPPRGPARDRISRSRTRCSTRCGGALASRRRCGASGWTSARSPRRGVSAHVRPHGAAGFRLSPVRYGRVVVERCGGQVGLVKGVTWPPGPASGDSSPAAFGRARSLLDYISARVIGRTLLTCSSTWTASSRECGNSKIAPLVDD